MGLEQKPFYHCEKCDCCIIGYPQYMKHCDKCNQCWQKWMFDNHKCVPMAETCPICLNTIINSNYPIITLNCLHQMHEHCYMQLLK